MLFVGLYDVVINIFFVSYFVAVTAWPIGLATPRIPFASLYLKIWMIEAS